MFFKAFLVLLHSTYLIPFGYSELTGRVELPIKQINYDLVVDVSIGNAKEGRTLEKMTAIFDTGSSGIWVVDTDTKPFDKDASKTFNEVKSTYSAAFAIGTISGSQGKDTIKIGEGDNAIVLDQQKFGLAKTIPHEFIRQLFVTYNVLFGVNLVSSADTDLFVNALREKYGKVPPIGFYITPKYIPKSKLIFGDDDNGLYTGDLNTHAVVNQNGEYNGWKIKITKIAVLDASEQPAQTFEQSDGTTAQVVSRVTPVLVGPRQLINNLNNKIFERFATGEYDSTKFSYNCGDVETYRKRLDLLPKVAIYIDNVQYIFTPEKYILTFAGFVCGSGFVGRDNDQLVLGEGFMAHYYTKLDFEKKQVQFAPANI